MKTCPKCGELNGNDREDCFKCRTSFPKTPAYRKICPKCGALYHPAKELCEDCGVRLSVYSPGQTTYADSGARWWHYALAILFPLFGVILGCIYFGRGEDDLGKTLITTSVVCVIIQIVLGILLAACSA